MWDIFGFLYTLNFVIVRSALHSVGEDVKKKKKGTGVVLSGAFLDGGLMSC